MSLVILIVFVGGFGLGRYVWPKALPAAPKMSVNLPEHLDTLRGVLEAAGELTPEAESWIVEASRPVLPPKSKLSFNDPEFRADYDVCETPAERGEVICRWHRRGRVFDLEMRKWILRGALNSDTRSARRRLFDEQDSRA